MRMPFSSRPACLGFVLFLSLLAPPLRADIAAANTALQQGRVDDAVRQLQDILAQQPSDSYAHLLLCRVYYAQDMANQAVHECEQAANIAPNDSDTILWLGKAYGLKAENAGPFTGLSLAKKVRTSFEKAVQLSPSNAAAASALGQYYVAAPAIVGGGLDKAQRVADQLAPYSPALAARLRAMIAEKRKDMGTAEAEFKNAVNAGHTPDAWVDLGHFYQRQNRLDQSVSALETAFNSDRSRDAALVDIASILTDAHRSPELAERALRVYLSSSAKSEAAPAFKAHLQLGDLLAKRGDKAGAQKEYAAALSLASHFAPAQQAMKGA